MQWERERERERERETKGGTVRGHPHMTSKPNPKLGRFLAYYIADFGCLRSGNQLFNNLKMSKVKDLAEA